ncbi:MAG: DUF1178 family protein [Gammaproteobacteria bacterium]|nr:MAG: DUF1178 family protein [Gammaproteobacteria bacterium]
MVIYDLDCHAGHQFEGWFGKPEDYSEQAKNGLLNCPVCGSTDVKRLPTASHVNTRPGADRHEHRARDKQPSARRLATASALAKIHKYVDEHFEDVGADFPEEARKIHYGETAAHNIQGTATPEEAQDLLDEGVEALPLPPRVTDKNKLN